MNDELSGKTLAYQAAPATTVMMSECTNGRAATARHDSQRRGLLRSTLEPPRQYSPVTDGDNYFDN